MLYVVVVQIAFAAEPSESQSGLVAACSSALLNTTCVLEEELKTQKDSEIRAVSLVTVEGDHAFVEVGMTEDRSNWRTERVDFAPADPVAERLRVLGFAVAALVDEVVPIEPEGAKTESRPAESKLNAPTEEKDSSSSAVPHSSEGVKESSRRATLALRAGPTLGRGLAGGGLRFGGRVEAEFFPETWPVGAVLWGGYQRAARDDAGFGAEFLELGLGPVCEYFFTPALSLGGRVGFHLEETRVSFVDETTGQEGSGSRLVPGGFFGLTGSYRFRDALGLRLVFDGTRFTGGTAVEAREGTTTTSGPSVPAWTWSGSLFFEARFSL